MRHFVSLVLGDVFFVFQAQLFEFSLERAPTNTKAASGVGAVLVLGLEGLYNVCFFEFSEGLVFLGA